MIKLNYPVRNSRWGDNDLIFESWEEYWKLLGYLSNRNIHRVFNSYANIDLIFERNSISESYTDTTRIYYYGSEENFELEFPSIYSIRKSVPLTSNATFRINRKEFGETLINDLGFTIMERCNKRDPVLIPPEQDEILARVSSYSEFNINSWNEGYNLGNL